MKSDLEKAKNLLKTGEYTCVLIKDDEVIALTDRGVKPLVALYESKSKLDGFVGADKVVGKATAFLYLMLGVKELYAVVISKTALKLLNEKGVKVHYDEEVDYIQNRQKNGICPFEESVLNLREIDEAYKAIRQKMLALNITI